MRRTLIIRHVPQECGDDTLVFVDLDTCEVYKTIIVPDGYCDSGVTPITTLHRTGEYTLHRECTKLPKIGDRAQRVVRCARRNKIAITDGVVNVVETDMRFEDNITMRIYDFDEIVGIYREETQYRFSVEYDTFRKKLEEQGVNMTGWCLYKRRKTEFRDFVKDVFKEYNIIQVLEFF